MKIAMLTSDYLPNIGGIASHIYELSKALIDNGHEVEVWVWNRKGIAFAEEGTGDVPVHLIAGDVVGGRFFLPSTLARQIEPLYRAFRPELIHVHTLDPLMPAMAHLKRKFPVKAVWTNHSSRYLRKIDSRFWKIKMRYYARAFDGILTTSQERLEKSLSLGLSANVCDCIPNGVSPDKYEPISKYKARSILGISQDSFVLLYTGRFAPIKGTLFLVQAVHKLSTKIPKLLCVMCGNIDGDRESDKIRSFILENNLENFIKMEGFIPNDSLGPYLYACDSLVLPSLMEATSISALEAMSVGRPIIGSRVGGIPELVTEGITGLLAIPGDSGDLARAIEKCWSTDNKEQMGINAKEKVLESFTWLKVAERTEKFYLSIM